MRAASLIADMNRSLSIIVNLLKGDKPGRLLESVRAQSNRGFELILTLPSADARLAERVVAWVERHGKMLPPTRLLPLEARNLSETRNAALREVRGDYAMFVDGDVRLDPDCIVEIRRELENDSAELIVLEAARRDADGWTERDYAADTKLLRTHLLDDVVAVPRIVVATERLHTIGGWDESNPDSADFILGCRLLASAQGITHLRNIPYVLLGEEAAANPLPPFNQIEHSLAEAKASLRNVSEEDPWQKWLAARRMILSGELTRLKQRDHARQLSDEALSTATTARERIKLGLIRDTQAYFGCGGRRLARMMF